MHEKHSHFVHLVQHFHCWQLSELFTAAEVEVIAAQTVDVSWTDYVLIQKTRENARVLYFDDSIK